MPLKVCAKCGAKVISSDPSPVFHCKNCAGAAPATAAVPTASPQASSAPSLRCPACQANFVGGKPSPTAVKGICPKCRKELVIHPDSRVQTFEEFQIEKAGPKVPPPTQPQATVEAAPEVEAVVSVEAELDKILNQGADAPELTASSTVALDKDQLPQEAPAKKDEPAKEDKLKPGTKRLSSGTSRFVKGKDTGRISQRVSADQPLIKEKKTSFYVGMVLAPMLVGFIMYVGKGIEPVGKLVQQAGDRTVTGINILAWKIAQAKMPRSVQKRVLQDELGIAETPQENGPERAVEVPPETPKEKQIEYALSDIVSQREIIVKRRRTAQQQMKGATGSQKATYQKELDKLKPLEDRLLNSKKAFVKQFGYEALKKEFDYEGFELEPESVLKSQ